MNRLIGTIPSGQILPGCARAKYPKNAIENLAAIAPGPTSPIGANRVFEQDYFDEVPLLFGQVLS